MEPSTPTCSQPSFLSGMLRSVGHPRRFAPCADPKQRGLSGLAGQLYQLRITGILGSSRSGRRGLRDTAAAYAPRCGKVGRPPCGEAKALPSDARATTPRRSVDYRRWSSLPCTGPSPADNVGSSGLASSYAKLRVATRYSCPLRTTCPGSTAVRVPCRQAIRSAPRSVLYRLTTLAIVFV